MKHHPLATHNEVHGATLKRSLTKVRTSLPPHLRILSVCIHWGPIEALSSFVERAAKPSFFIGAGLASFTATLLLFNTARTYGYEFNHTGVLLALCIGGVAGLLIELLVRATRNL